LYSDREAVMSLSRFFKDQSGFRAENLVPRPYQDSDNWQPVTISDDIIQEKDHEHAVNEAQLAEAEQQASELPSVPGNQDTNQSSELHDTPIEQQRVPEPDVPAINIEQLQEEAFKAGMKEGLKQAEADFGSTLSALNQVCDELNVVRETILKNSKGEMIELILTLAEKIIRRSVTEQDETIIATLEDSIKQAVKSSEFYVYLHPDDMLTIEEKSQDFISGINGLENLVLKTDKTIERGGCRIESDNCTVDATISSQLEILKKQMREES